MHSHTNAHTHTHAYACTHTPCPRLRIHIHHGHPHGHPDNTHTLSATATAVVRSRRFCSVLSATIIISQKKVSLICNFAPPLGHEEGGGGVPPPDIREGVRVPCYCNALPHPNPYLHPPVTVCRALIGALPHRRAYSLKQGRVTLIFFSFLFY